MASSELHANARDPIEDEGLFPGDEQSPKVVRRKSACDLAAPN